MPEVGLVKVENSLDKNPTPCFFALVRTDLDVFPTKGVTPFRNPDFSR